MASQENDTVAFIQEWMMSGDHTPSQWDRDFAAAIDARAESKLLPVTTALADLVSWFSGKPTEPEWRIKAGKYGADDAIAAARAVLATDEGAA